MSTSSSSSSAAGDAKVQVKVKPRGSLVELSYTMSLSDTIGDLKAKIQSYTNIAVKRQTLSLSRDDDQEAIMEDRSTLASHGLVGGGTENSILLKVEPFGKEIWVTVHSGLYEPRDEVNIKCWESTRVWELESKFRDAVGVDVPWSFHHNSIHLCSADSTLISYLVTNGSDVRAT